MVTGSPVSSGSQANSSLSRRAFVRSLVLVYRPCADGVTCESALITVARSVHGQVGVIGRHEGRQALALYPSRETFVRPRKDVD